MESLLQRCRWNWNFFIARNHLYNFRGFVSAFCKYFVVSFHSTRSAYVPGSSGWSRKTNKLNKLPARRIKRRKSSTPTSWNWPPTSWTTCYVCSWRKCANRTARNTLRTPFIICASAYSSTYSRTVASIMFSRIPFTNRLRTRWTRWLASSPTSTTQLNTSLLESKKSICGRVSSWVLTRLMCCWQRWCSSTRNISIWR